MFLLKGGDYVTIIAPGVPNITGSFKTSHCDVGEGTGAFTTTQGVRSVWGSDETGNATTVNFSASKSNSIYGASATVQPPTINAIIQVRF